MFHRLQNKNGQSRVGAREAAVHRTTACSSATAKINSLGVIPAGSTITCVAGTNVGDPVEVTITSSFRVGLPGYFGVPALNESFTIQGKAKERLE